MATEYLRVTIHSAFSNQQAVNVLHYRTSYPGVGLTPVDLMLGFTTHPDCDALRVAFKECLAQEATFLGMKVRYLHPDNLNLDQETITTEGAGAGTADFPGILPTQLCGLISKKTALASRQGRGRFYMPFVPGWADEEPDALVTAAYLTLLTDLAAELRNPFQATIAGLVVDYTPGLFRDRVNPVFRPLTDTLVRGGFATQRRRGYFGRPNSVTI